MFCKCDNIYDHFFKGQECISACENGAENHVFMIQSVHISMYHNASCGIYCCYI